MTGAWRSVFVALPFLVLGGPLEPKTHALAFQCNANPYDSQADSADIQACLDNGGTVELDTGGTYYIDQELRLTVPGTTLTANGSGSATLRAHTNLHGRILSAESVAGYTIRRINFIGRKLAGWTNRTIHAMGGACESHGLNVFLSGSGFTVDGVESAYAPCGTGMVAEGSNFEIKDSYFHDNGYDSDGSWSDGLTIWRCDGGWVHHNTAENNTDVGIVVGGGSGCTIENNQITNTSIHAFAGIHIGWFPPGAGNHGGSVYRNNTISSSMDGMAFGLVVGFEPWWDDNPPFDLSSFVSNAGSVTGNSITGAVVNLGVSGIGTGYVHGNSMSSAQGFWGFPETVPYLRKLYRPLFW